MSILSERWYTEKAVKKINPSDLSSLVLTSNADLESTPIIPGSIFTVDIELDTILDPSLAKYAEGEKIPLLFIPPTSDNPITNVESSLGESYNNRFVGSINTDLEELANKFRKEKGEIYHFVIKVPIVELLEKHWQNKYPLFSTKAFLTEISNGNMIQLLKTKTLSEFVEFERSKKEKVGKVLNIEPTDILSLNISADKPVPSPYNNILESIFTSKQFIASKSASLYSWVMTPRYWASTGNASSGALMYFETLLFITPEVSDILNSLRDNAGLTKKQPEAPIKHDDPDAKFISDLTLKYPADRLQDNESIKRSRPTTSQFERVIQRVRSRVEKVPDTAFTRMLLNVDKIETVEDVFEFVYDIVPVSQILQIAVDCLLSRLDFEWDSVVCETIINGINDFEGDQTVKDILAYTNINLNTDIIAQNFKVLLIDEFFKSFGDPAIQEIEESGGGFIPDSLLPQFKGYLIEVYNQSVQGKNAICAMIFAAAPAAAVLLVLLIKDEIEKAKRAKEIANKRSKDVDGNSGEKIKDFFEKIISSPVEDLLQQIENGLKNHPILSFTENFVDNFNNGIILLIEQLCVSSITYILKEIVALCEDSEAADYSNAPIGLDGIRSNNIDENFITEPVVYNNLFDFLYERQPDLNIDQSLLASFFNDIGSLLTISELCLLFDGDPSGSNYSFVLDKVWYGLLSLEVYEQIANILSTKQLLIDFINIFADQFDDSLCSDKIEELITNKKTLNKICKSGQNGAFVEDLSDKLSAGAIQNMLDEDKQRITDLLKAIKNLVDPNAPQVFCQGDPDSSRTPLVETFLDPSTVEISRKTLQSSLSAAEKTFEFELENFDIILTNKNEKFSNASQLFDNVGKVGEILKSLYGFNPETVNQNTTNYEADQDNLKSSLRNIVENAAIVAPKTLETINEAGKNLITNIEERESGPVISIALNAQPGENVLVSGGEIVYVLNYSNEPYSAIPLEGDIPEIVAEDGQVLSEEELLELQTIVAPLTAKLIYEREPDSSGDRNFFSFSSELPTFSIQDDGTNYFLNSNDLSNSIYDNKIKSLLSSHSFYGSVLEQIIKEHAEYITNQDLFKRTNFDKLQLVKQFACDTSLFNYQDIIGNTEVYYEKVKKIGCADGFGNIPTPPEKLNIYNVYESYILVLTATEMLKSLFSFASFGLQALLPESGLTDQFGSFYFEYLIGEVEQNIYLSQPPVINSNSQKVLIEVYSALNDKDKNQITLRDVNREILSNNIKRIQNVLYNKLSRSGIPTKITDFQSSNNQFGQLADEFVDASLVGIDAKKTFLGNILTVPETGYFGPPKILGIDFETGFLEIPSGFYSNDSRLKNGGFYIEEGVEINHKLKGSTEITEQSINEVISFLDENIELGYTGQQIEQSVYNISKSLTSKYLFGSAPNSAFDPGSSSKQSDYPCFIRDKKFSIDSNKFGTFLLDGNPSIQSLLNTEGHISYASEEYNQYLSYFKQYTPIKADGSTDQPSAGSLYLNDNDLLNIYLASNIFFSNPSFIPIYNSNELIQFFSQYFYYSEAEAFEALSIQKKQFEDPFTPNLTKQKLDEKKELVRVTGQVFDSLDKKFYVELLNSSVNNNPYVIKLENKPRFGLSEFGLSGQPFDDYLVWDITEENSSLVKEFPGITKLLNALKGDLLPEPTSQTLQQIENIKINDSIAIASISTSNTIKGFLREQTELPLVEQGYDFAWAKFLQYDLENPSPSEEELQSFQEGNAESIQTVVRASGINHPWFQEGGPSGIDVAFMATFPGLVFRAPVLNESIGNLLPQLAFVEPFEPMYKVKLALALQIGLYSPLALLESPDEFVNFVQSLIGGAGPYQSITNDYDYMKSITKTSNYFQKINHYKTLNILIPYSEIQEVFGDIEFGAGSATFNAQQNPTSAQSRRDFLFKAGQEKKFLLIEKETGEKYFKLPLVKLNNNQTLPEKINNIQNILARPASGLLQVQFVFSPEFSALVSSLDYKNLLSFVAILVKESLESSYDDLNNIFSRTISIIRNNSANLRSIANRNPNEIWASNTDSLTEELNTPNQAEINLAYEFLKGIIKSVANMSDPTWKTEWFLPGPLTPIGVVAKFLEGHKGDTSASQAPGENKPKFEVIESKTEPPECKD